MKVFDRMGGVPRRIPARKLDPLVLLPAEPTSFPEGRAEEARR
jgi:hypothetical protein